MDSSYPNSLVATAAIATLLISLYVLKRIVIHRKRNYAPIAGTVLHQLLNFNRIADYQTDLSKKYRTFRMLAPFTDYVYTVDPANVEYMLKSNFSNYGKGDFNHDVMKDFLGDGIFAVDGDKWRQQRKVASFEFSTKVLRDYSTGVFKITASKLTRIISELASTNQMMDIQDLLMKATLDSIFKIGFGVELGALSGFKHGKAFSEAFDQVNCQMLYRYVDVFWKIERYLNVGSEAKMKKNLQWIDNFIYEVIDNKAKQSQINMEKEDILSRFLIEKERDPSNINNKYLRDIILNFVIAGRDTSAGTLAWFFCMLCKHPNIQEKIAREVRKATKMENNNVDITEFTDCLTEEAISDMQYLQASLTETLRLYPAVPVDVKCCFSDDTLPDGYDIKKGDLINYQPYAMGRMKFLWGDDAEEFKPERWINEEGLFVPESPFKFTAFQAGPRICLGKEFAYRQMKILAATLLYFFEFKFWDEQRKVKAKTMITLQIDGGLHLCAVSR